MQYIFIFVCLFALLNCKTEINQDIITIDVKIGLINSNIGTLEPKISLGSNYVDNDDNFDASDIEEETKFSFTITGNKSHTYPMNCRLWENEEKEIKVFCDLEGEFKETEEFPIKESVNITYKSTKNVTINFDIDSFVLEKIEGKLPFLYSNTQIINLEGNEPKVNLKFKMSSYNDEKLYVYHDYTFAPIENCKKGNKVLNCEISREKLDIIANKENEFVVCFLNEFLGLEDFDYVNHVKINYPDIEKETIHFNFTKIENPDVEIQYFVNFETNIVNFPILKTSFFKLQYSQDNATECFFIKHEKSKPLYLSCSVGYTGNFTIEGIQGFEAKNIHHKYDFIADPQDFKGTISSTEPYNSVILNVYPETLDFTKKDSIEVYVETQMNTLIENIRLNPDGEDLKCDNIGNHKKCTVPKSHFKEKKTGYYLFHHNNNIGGYTANYETFGVNVILPGDNSGNSGEISKYTFSLFALLCILIL